VGVELIALDAGVGLAVKEEQSAISDYRIGRGPEETLRVAMRPNDVSRGVGHFSDPRGIAPGQGDPTLSR
jgi:hypothetical protein